MDKKIVIVKYVAPIIFSIIMVPMFFLNIASAQWILGCPKDEIVMYDRKPCPDGSEPSVVKEGYIRDGNIVLDALSKEEKDSLGIIYDNKFVIVVYRSLRSGEASFNPGKDSSGRAMERVVVNLEYGCNAKGCLASKKIFPSCKELGDKVVWIPKHRESMRRSIEESWPKFYSQFKQQGFNDEKIKSLWEEEKNRVYKEYNYDPKTDKFNFENLRHVINTSRE